MDCPKCNAPMTQFYNEDVCVDQCTKCRGIFLDAGELMAIKSRVKSEAKSIGNHTGFSWAFWEQFKDPDIVTPA